MDVWGFMWGPSVGSIHIAFIDETGNTGCG